MLAKSASFEPLKGQPEILQAPGEIDHAAIGICHLPNNDVKAIHLRPFVELPAMYVPVPACRQSSILTDSVFHLD